MRIRTQILFSRKYKSLPYTGYLLLVGLCFACQSALHKNYHPDTYEADVAEISKSKALSRYELSLMETYIYNVEYTSNNIELKNMRYIDILHLAQEREAWTAQRLQPLQDIVSVEVLDKGFDTLTRGREFITFQTRITNHSTRDILQLKGKLRAESPSGEWHKYIRLGFQDTLFAETQVDHLTGSLYFIYNREDNLMKGTPLDKMKIIWQPKYIRFANNEELIP